MEENNSDDKKNGNGGGEPENTQRLGDDAGIDLALNFLPDRVYILPLKQRPLFPGMVLPFQSNEPLFAHTVSSAMKSAHRVIGFALQKDTDAEDRLSFNDIYHVGVVGRILKAGEDENSHYQMLVQVVSRMEIVDFFREGPVYAATISYPKPEPDLPASEIRAHTLAIIQALKDVMRLNPLFQEEMRQLMSSTSINDPSRLADFAASLTSAEPFELQEILETFPIIERLRKVLLLLKKEIEINEIKEKINKQMQERLSTQQREYFLREQLRAIKQELGLEKDEKSAQTDKYHERLKQLKVPDDVRKVIEEELEKYSLLEPHSAEFGVVRNYLDWLLALPWGIETEDNLDPKAARKILDRDHFGLDDVKQRIVEFIAVSKLKGSLTGSILCLVGPPGVGKTSIGRAVAEALGRKFFRFSLGGMRDEAEIKGHRRTYVGAMPGKIMQSIRTVGTANPVIMLDEIDKVGISYQGDPASALLEVLDPEQNFAFSDHYLDVPFDLTKVLFIATANVPDTIPAPLLDRMEVIHLSGYILEEKVQIARRHIIPKQLSRHNIPLSQVKITDPAIRKLINDYAREAGVRNLERAVTSILRKIAVDYAEKGVENVKVSDKDVEKYLGKPRFPEEAAWKKLEAGVVMGLAWTPMGGTTLYIESAAIPSNSGGFRQTGQLGSVMIESTAIAYSYIKEKARDFGADPAFFDTHSIHLHVPAGATPKDGPSAGVTMATSLLSLALARPIRKKVAMTGELTLTGRVLPVGGIKEKVIAARKSGVKTILLPKENTKDLEEIPEYVKEGIEFIFVDHYEDVAKVVFPKETVK
ncbi:MAG: endopeptidase La [Candidatus Brocadiia bacterium]